MIGSFFTRNKSVCNKRALVKVLLYLSENTLTEKYMITYESLIETLYIIQISDVNNMKECLRLNRC